MIFKNFGFCTLIKFLDPCESSLALTMRGEGKLITSLENKKFVIHTFSAKEKWKHKEPKWGYSGLFCVFSYVNADS